MTIIAKKKEKATIEIIGGNSESVTGSCTKIKYQDEIILFELGMIQDGHTSLENYKLNTNLLKKIKPKEISAIIIGHNHLDHIGLIPALYSIYGCNAKIIAPKNSIPILREMWLDSVHIMQRDYEILSVKYDKHYIPLYNEDNVNMALSHVEEYDCDKIYKINELFSFRYTYAGHILNSCQCELYINQGNHTRKILFTSDLGNIITEKEKIFVQPFKPVTNANIVIGEATYSKRGRSLTKKDFETDKQKIKTVIEQYCVDNNHRVLIPCFSLDKFPYTIWLLYKMFGQDTNFNVPIVLDSPLSNRLLDCYSSILDGEEKNKFDEMMSWKNIRRIINPEDSKAAIAEGGAKVILASSGMLVSGRSVKWTESILPNSNDCILFMGYAGVDTLGYKIKNGSQQKTISINGKPIKNRANIVDLHSFSSHMQRNELINYYKNINCERIYLVHSDLKDRIELKEDLQIELSNMCKSTKIICTNRSTKISL